MKHYARANWLNAIYHTLVPSVFVPLDQRSSLRSKERRLEVRECIYHNSMER